MRCLPVSLAALVFGVTSSAAHAGIVGEIEPNNSFAGAQMLSAAEFPGALIVDAMLGPDGTPSGVDYFSFPVAESGYRILLSLFVSPGAIGDGRLGLFSPAGGAPIMSVSGPGKLNLDSGQVTATGDYRVAVTGANDTSFSGSGHQSVFSYKLVVGVNVPTPASGVLMGFGALVILRRRRMGAAR